MVTDIKGRGGERSGAERRGGEGRGREGPFEKPRIMLGCPGTDITPPARLEGMEGSNKYNEQTGDPAWKEAAAVDGKLGYLFIGGCQV